MMSVQDMVALAVDQITDEHGKVVGTLEDRGRAARLLGDLIGVPPERIARLLQQENPAAAAALGFAT